MNNFSFGKYADAPYDMISREFASNEAFQKSSKKVLIITGIVGIFFLTAFIVFIVAIFFLIFILSTQKNSKFKSVILYWIDYSIMKQLEKTGEIHLSEEFRSRLPTREFIQEDLVAPLKQTPHNQSYSQEKEIQLDPISKPQDIHLDTYRFESPNSKQIKLKTRAKNKVSKSRKSVFDDYVSVRESFKKIRNR